MLKHICHYLALKLTLSPRTFVKRAIALGENVSVAWTYRPSIFTGCNEHMLVLSTSAAERAFLVKVTELFSKHPIEHMENEINKLRQFHQSHLHSV